MARQKLHRNVFDHNEEKSLVNERFIKTLKSKIYKYMNLTSINVYIDKLDDIVNKYKDTYHSAIKMKPLNVKSNACFNSGKEINDEDRKFKIGDNVVISKYKNIFAKRYVPNWSDKVFVIKRIKNSVLWAYVIIDLKGEREFEKINQKEFRVEKVITKRW